MRGIFVVAGHGLSATGALDNGASGNGTTERKEVVEIAGDLGWRLTNDPGLFGIETFMIGVTQRMSLRQKIDQVNQVCRERGWTADDTLLVSIHINSAGAPQARGLEAWYSANEGTFELANNIVQRTAQTTGLPIRAVPTRTTDQNRHGRLGIIDDTTPRGVLVEAGFITNEFDAELLKNEQMDNKIAQGIHIAVREFLMLPGIDPFTTLPSGAYADVAPDAWYHDDVALCLREGLFVQSPERLFHPDQPLTRAELAAVMARHLRKHHNVS